MTAKKINRILLPQIPLFEKTSSSEVWARGRLLPFLLEEFISLGVLEVIIRDSWRYRQEILDLPQAFKNRVVIAESERHGRIAIKLFEPFFEEYGLEASEGAVRHIRTARGEDKAIIDAGVSAFFNLPEFLSALSHKAQVHFDVAEIKSNLSLLKDGSRSSEMRANASSLIGIFSSYQTVAHDAPILHGNAPEELVRRFTDFTEDLYYQELSKQMHALGFFKTAIQAIPKINRAARRFIERKANRQMLNFGSKAVTVATGVPLPTSSLAESLLSEEYLPPIVDLSAAISTAKGNFSIRGNTKGILGFDPELDRE